MKISNIAIRSHIEAQGKRKISNTNPFTCLILISVLKQVFEQLYFSLTNRCSGHGRRKTMRPADGIHTILCDPVSIVTFSHSCW